jgi:hypothetical protein
MVSNQKSLPFPGNAFEIGYSSRLPYFRTHTAASDHEVQKSQANKSSYFFHHVPSVYNVGTQDHTMIEQAEAKKAVKNDSTLFTFFPISIRDFSNRFETMGQVCISAHSYPLSFNGTVSRSLSFVVGRPQLELSLMDLLHKPQIGPPGEDGPNDWRDPEKPELSQRPPTHEYPPSTNHKVPINSAVSRLDRVMSISF